MFAESPPWALFLLEQMKTMTGTMSGMRHELHTNMHEMKKEMHSNKDELLQGVMQANTRAVHAEELSRKAAHEVHELRAHIAQQQHTIDDKEAQLRLWQLQSEQDRPARAEKQNTVYITPTPSNTTKTPFSAEDMDYSQASISTKPNTRGGVEVKCSNREQCAEMLKQYPNVKNTQKPYRAAYAKTPLQQHRDRLFYVIKQRLPRGVTGYMSKGHLYVTNAAVPIAKKGEAPSDCYPSWLHVKTSPAGMDISAEPVNMDEVPHYAHQVLELAECAFKLKKGNNTHTTPMRTLTDGGPEAEISDVEMADRAARGRRSPTGETPGPKRAAKK